MAERSNDEWDANQILDYLYLGSEDAAHAPFDTIQSRGITHILVCGFGLIAKYPDTFKYHKLKLIDLPISSILEFIKAGCDFINDAKNNNGKVLVHCARGVSRSAAIVCAYLITEEGMSYEDAVYLLRNKRPCVSINYGFEKDLKTLNKQ